ncbi:MAG: Sec-independent protein translocase protein TatB [Bacillota bacterium]
MQLGTMELLIILVVALIVVGPAKLPELGRALGRGMREFRKATSSLQDELEKTMETRDQEEKKPDTDTGRGFN